MSHTRALHLSSLLRPAARPPLPFLYQTRSLAQYGDRAYRPRDDRPADDADSNIPFASDAATADTSDPWSYLHSPSSPRAAAAPPRPKPRAPTSRAPHPVARNTEHMIPHPLTRRRTGNAVDIYGARGSFVNNSVTLREREVFSQIFHDILAPRAAGAPPAVSATATGPAATTLPPALASLLGATSASSLSFAPPAAATLQLPPRTPRADATDAAANRVDLARLTQLRDALHATDTDAASLAWLDAHLFPLLAARDPSNLFAELFNSALALFHKRYHDPATVVALFERVKRAGVDAYVLGCDARTYNRVMRATWQAYGDVERVRALAEEMRANGVEPNFFTPKELARVVDEVRAVLEGRMGELARMCVSEVEAETVEWLDEEARRMKSVMRRENKNVLVAAAMKEAAMAQGRGEREERAREWGWPQEAERPYQR